MDCAQAKTLLGAYIDQELDLRSALEIEEHLKSCESCARTLANHQVLRKGLSSPVLSYSAPAALRRRVLAATADRAPSLPPSRPAWHEWLAWRPMTMAASFAAFVLILSSGTLRWRSLQREDAVAEEVVAGHVRSLEASHLTDVLSSDRHTVKPWFAGKLDYAPPVEDFAADGFPLVGGRLDYVGGRPVSALVYRRAGHTINLYVWPGSGESPQTSRAERGFHVTRWTRKGMSYWAVSDLNEEELSRFASLLRTRE
jgi:anti-sigma factor RsiW